MSVRVTHEFQGLFVVTLYFASCADSEAALDFHYLTEGVIKVCIA